jgi:peptidoglycan hydrolase CwlO-like protein
MASGLSREAVEDELTMRFRDTAYRTCALTLAVALVPAALAYAAPGDTTQTASPSTAATPSVTATVTVRPAPSPSAIPVPVDPQTAAFREELARRQARLDEFRAQLDELDRQLGIATESYNEASSQLVEIQSMLSTTREDLGTAQFALQEQRLLLATRVDAMYRDGELSAAEILLGSSSIPDFFQRLEFIRTIASADANVASELEFQRAQIEDHSVDLQTAAVRAAALEFALNARKLEIEYRIEDRQAMMAGAQNDLLELLDSEAARRAVDEFQLWRDIVAGAGQAGVTIEPNSPAETALAYHGIPYIWAGDDPSGFDCSGLTMYVMRQHGVSLPHHAASQYLLGKPVQMSQLQAGDLVFFGSPVYHVGMYVGGGYFVHAPRTGDYIKVSRLAERSDFVGARRYPWRYRAGDPTGLTEITLPAGLTTAR